MPMKLVSSALPLTIVIPKLDEGLLLISASPGETCQPIDEFNGAMAEENPCLETAIVRARHPHHTNVSSCA